MLHTDLHFPLIMVSTDLNSPNVVLLESGKYEVCEQLKSIGQYAEEIKNITSISLEKMRTKLDTLGECRNVRLSRNLSESLFDIVAANAISNFTRDISVTKAKVSQAVREGVAIREQRLKNAENSLDDSNIDSVNELKLSESEYYSYRKLVLLNASRKRIHKAVRTSRSPEPNILFESKEFAHGPMLFSFVAANITAQKQPVETATSIVKSNNLKLNLGTAPKGMLQTSLQTLIDYNDYVGYLEVPIEGFEEYGLSSGVKENYSHLAQDLYDVMCFEMESSVEQVIRSVKGIMMPEFYMKYCGGRKCKVDNGDHMVDFNIFDTKTSSWRPPSFGDAMYALQKMIKDGTFKGNWDCYNVFSQLEIVSKAIVINGFRNSGAGHSRKINRKEFEEMLEFFMPFWNDYFTDIIAVRKELLNL